MTLARKDWEILFSHLDGAASSSQLDALRERARQDSEFRFTLEQAEAIAESLESLPAALPPVDLVSAAQRQLTATRATRSPRLWPRRLGFAAGLAAAAAAAMLLFFSRSGQPELSQPARLALVASDVRGEVWVHNSAGRRTAVPGETILSGERIETGDGARLVVRAGSHINLVVDHGTRVDVIGLEAERPMLVLEAGALRVAVTDVPGALEVRLGYSAQRVETAFGEVGLLHDDGGTTVACNHGAATLRDDSQLLHLRAGEQALARPQGFLPPEPLPESLQLQLEPLPLLAADQLQVRFSGTVSPGAEIVIDGKRVAVDNHGRFTFELSVAKDAPSVMVRARDALLREDNREVALLWQRPSQPRLPAKHTPLRTEWEWETPG